MENIAVLGDPIRIQEFQQKVSNSSQIIYWVEGSAHLPDFGGFELVIDLTLDEHAERMGLYAPHPKLLVIAGSARTTLTHLAFQHTGDLACKLLGINSLPTFLNRDRWELSSIHEEDQKLATPWLEQLGIQAEWVADRPGMVTPRILFMIINEACFTLQEGTAGIADIDQAMRLGTNYPAGPFEWADRIGLAHIHAVLSSLLQETGDGRYKIAPLLTKYMMQNRKFYPS